MTGRTTNLKQPLASEDYVKEILRRSRERSPSLGDLCKFDLKGIEIAPTVLFELLQKLGLEDWQPVQIRKRTAARKAITRMKYMLEDPANDLKVMVRRVPTMETDVVRYALIDESPDVTGLDLDYSTRNQVIFREDTETMEFTKSVNKEILDEFRYMCSVYTDAEVSMMVRNLVTNHGCLWFRDHSGMFFMPYPHKSIVDSLVKLFEAFSELTDQTCYFRPIALLDDSKNRATMGEALITDITLQLQDAFDLLEDATSESIKKGSKRPKTTLGGALRQFKTAKAKARIYKDMLEINLDDINARIEAANQKASELMVEFSAPKPTKDLDKDA